MRFAAQFLDRIIVAALAIAGSHASTWAQEVNVGEIRPFVVGVMPVVGNGAVGGVAVDARGALSRAEQRDLRTLQEARLAALQGQTGDVAGPSPLRKISLRRLDALLSHHARQGKPLTPDILHLAGLLRIEYVFAFPETRDLVLAGPAEGWTVDDAGNVVGEDSGAAVLQLVDLIAALRTTDKLLAGEMISCSIDPTPQGRKQYARLLHATREAPSDQWLAELEHAVGPQEITLTGIPPESHYAQVLVAADWQMKRLAMGLAPSPVDGLPSYLELAAERPAVSSRSAMPRWWLAYGERPVERDDEGLAWRVSQPGVRVCTAEGRVQSDGRVAAQSESNPLARQWADAMTARFDQLALVEPVFGQLRGCMDLALVTAVLASGDLLAHVGLELPMILDDARLQLAPHPVPRTVDSYATAIRARRGWVVSVSGGVELDVSAIVNQAGVQPQLAKSRSDASPRQDNLWWWD